MRLSTYCLTGLLLLIGTTLSAQNKSELQATVAKLTAQNDSLQKALTTATDQNKTSAKLIDTLSVMTGVKVNDLDTVKTVLELRAKARTANTDSLTQARSGTAKLQLALDSVNLAYTKLKAECATATPGVTPAVTDTPATGSPAAVSGGQTDQLMKLNNMYEQGLLTKDEFMKLKSQLMK